MTSDLGELQESKEDSENGKIINSPIVNEPTLSPQEIQKRTEDLEKMKEIAIQVDTEASKLARESLGVPERDDQEHHIIETREGKSRGLFIEKRFLPTEQVERVEGFNLDETVERWNDQGYKIEQYGNKASVVILGEIHHQGDLQRKQNELIREIKPQFVLHEFLDGWMYNPQTKKFVMQSGRRFSREDVRPEGGESLPLEHGHNFSVSDELIALSNEIGFQIIGCDLTKGEISEEGKKLAKKFPKRYGYSRMAGLFDRKNPERFINQQSTEIDEIREPRMAQTIIDCQRKSERPVVAIMGAAHGENLHNQRKLQRKGFGYIFVNQR